VYVLLAPAFHPIHHIPAPPYDALLKIVTDGLGQQQHFLIGKQGGGTGVIHSMISKTLQPLLVIFVDSIQNADVAVCRQFSNFLRAFPARQKPDYLAASSLYRTASLLVVRLQLLHAMLQLQLYSWSSHATILMVFPNSL
jgi:hypothetical protein